MSAPRIEIDFDKLEQNTRRLAERLGKKGIRITAVTKAVCGRPDIARAMLRGGVAGLGDAHIENVERMRGAGIRSPICLIRTPMISQTDRVTRACDASYNTELDTIHALAQSALRANRVHGVILMVEMGDLREGIMPSDLNAIARKVMAVPGVELKGIGANFACLSSAPPDAQAIAELSELAIQIEKFAESPLEVVSGGNSANLPLIFDGGSTGRIDDLRLGEAILLGVDPISGCPIDGLCTDAFTLVAEVIETHTKLRASAFQPIVPSCERIRIVSKPDPIQRSILAIGRQDTDIEGLLPPSGLNLIGATSDHLIVETPNLRLAIGAEIAFQPNYSALMRVMAAPNVDQVIKTGTYGNAPVHQNTSIPA